MTCPKATRLRANDIEYRRAATEWMHLSRDQVCRRSSSRRRRGAARAADLDRTPSCWHSAGPSWPRDRALRTGAPGGSFHRKKRSRQRCRAAGPSAPDSHRVGNVASAARSRGPILIGSSRTFLMAMTTTILPPSSSTQVAPATWHLAWIQTGMVEAPGFETQACKNETQDRATPGARLPRSRAGPPPIVAPPQTGAHLAVLRRDDQLHGVEASVAG